MPNTVILWFIVFAGLSWLSFRVHPIWGLGCYLFVFYASPSHHWYGAYIPDFRWSLLASLITFGSLWVNRDRITVKQPWFSNGAAKVLFAYTAWMWIQLLWALSFQMHLDATILFTKYVILFYMIYYIVDNDKRFYQFIMFNILGGLYWGYIIKGLERGGRIERIGGPGVSDSNTLGMHLAVVIVFAALILLKKNTIFKNRLLWWLSQVIVFISAILMANGIVQTISRSAAVGLLAGGIVLFLLNHKVFRKKFIIYAMIAIAGILYYTPEHFWFRMETVRTAVQTDDVGEIEASAFSRIVIAEAQLEMFKRNVMGHGHRGTVVLSPYYLPPEYLTYAPGSSGGLGRGSHNTFLTTLVEQGIPGAVLYLLALLWGIKTVLSFKKDDATIYLYVMIMTAGLTAVFVSGNFVDYLKVEIQIFCLAMLASLKEYERIKSASKESVVAADP